GRHRPERGTRPAARSARSIERLVFLVPRPGQVEDPSSVVGARYRRERPRWRASGAHAAASAATSAISGTFVRSSITRSTPHRGSLRDRSATSFLDLDQRPSLLTMSFVAGSAVSTTVWTVPSTVWPTPDVAPPVVRSTTSVTVSTVLPTVFVTVSTVFPTGSGVGSGVETGVGSLDGSVVDPPSDDPGSDAGPSLPARSSPLGCWPGCTMSAGDLPAAPPGAGVAALVVELDAAASGTVADAGR